MNEEDRKEIERLQAIRTAAIRFIDMANRFKTAKLVRPTGWSEDDQMKLDEAQRDLYDSLQHCITLREKEPPRTLG